VEYTYITNCSKITKKELIAHIVRATPSNIPKWVSCRLYKNSGSGEMRLMGDHDRIQSGTISGQLVKIGASHQIWWNILREHNWGVSII